MIYLRDRYAVLPDLRDSTVEDLQVTNLLMSDPNNNLGKQSQSVTAVITHRVRDGRSEGYEEWIRESLRLLERFQDTWASVPFGHSRTHR